MTLPLFKSPLSGGTQENSTNDNPSIEIQEETLENPEFEPYEATKIQLFFDLFFVANLTTFTDVHEINDMEKLLSYIGFFCILWFTWCQVTLYDVRFTTDSIFERVAHSVHFGVMIGLAVVGPQFDPLSASLNTLQQLSLILMVSRCALFVQYGLILFFSRKYKQTRIPLLLVMASLLVAILMYLALSFVFSYGHKDRGYIAWYVVAVFEVGANITIAGRWRFLSFKHTQLVERMSELTLIVLGEGVIGLTSRIAKIESLDFAFTPSAIGSIVAAVAIIYLTYQIYFDNIQLQHFGTIRQQIWAFLHFPFHMFLVLFMEGVNQFVIYLHVIENVVAEFAPVTNLPLNSTRTQYFNTLNATVESVFNTFSPSDESAYFEVANALDELNETANPHITIEEFESAYATICKSLLKAIANSYGVVAPETPHSETESVEDALENFFALFRLVFGYFFLSAGLVLISISVLSALSVVHSEHAITETRRRYIGIVANFLLGLGLALLTCMLLTSSATELGESPWTLPLMVFVLLIALGLNHVPTRTQKLNKEQ